MIRAVVKNGSIQPLEPLPPSWDEGHEVIVDEPQGVAANEAEDPNQWAMDMNSLTAALDDPREWQEIDAALAAADRQAKDLVRREMGIS